MSQAPLPVATYVDPPLPGDDVGEGMSYEDEDPYAQGMQSAPAIAPRRELAGAVS